MLSCFNNAGPYFGKGASFLGNLTLPNYNMLLPNMMIIGCIADHILPTHNLLKKRRDISAISVARVILGRCTIADVHCAGLILGSGS